jgi:hypothetical protein
MIDLKSNIQVSGTIPSPLSQIPRPRIQPQFRPRSTAVLSGLYLVQPTSTADVALGKLQFQFEATSGHKWFAINIGKTAPPAAVGKSAPCTKNDLPQGRVLINAQIAAPLFVAGLSKKQKLTVLFC